MSKKDIGKENKKENQQEETIEFAKFTNLNEAQEKDYLRTKGYLISCQSELENNLLKLQQLYERGEFAEHELTLALAILRDKNTTEEFTTIKDMLKNVQENQPKVEERIAKITNELKDLNLIIKNCYTETITNGNEATVPEEGIIFSKYFAKVLDNNE